MQVWRVPQSLSPYVIHPSVLHRPCLRALAGHLLQDQDLRDPLRAKTIPILDPQTNNIHLLTRTKFLWVVLRQVQTKASLQTKVSLLISFRQAKILIQGAGRVTLDQVRAITKGHHLQAVADKDLLLQVRVVMVHLKGTVVVVLILLKYRCVEECRTGIEGLHLSKEDLFLCSRALCLTEQCRL